jgi:arylsulfatase A-like enzyme/Tfp pilus assembly protein PilF
VARKKRTPPVRSSPLAQGTESRPPRSRGPLAAGSITVLILLVLAGAWWWRAGSTHGFVVTADQNILLVTIDTLRGDALGVYGGRAATPNLDRLASEGLRFTFAHAHAVMTLPSHASILTGRYPFEHGARDNAGYRVDDSVRTLAESARERGLATGAFVGAFPLDRQFGLARGFDVYDDVAGETAGSADFLFTERRAPEVVEAATKWIEGQQNPWLAWVHLFDPHSPYAAPAPFGSQYAGDPYAGEVAYTDHALGPLLELARRSSRPTTIIVTADHGEGLGEHGETTHGVFAYESTLRVPLIVAQVGAGIGAHGAVVDTPVQHVDVVPTVAELCGLSIPGDLPGRSLLASVLDPRADRISYFEAMTAMLKRGWAPLRGVIVGREKYIDLPLEELYDLAADPRETGNRFASAQERARQLAAHLKTMNATLPGEQVDENAEARARLQSLGYLSGSAARKQQYTEDDDPKRLIDVDRLMLDGIELHRQGRGGDAADAYRRVIARRPDMELAYRRLAYIQWEMGNIDDAMATLRETLARNGPDVDVEIRLGTYLAEAGRAAEAIPMLERALKAEPDNADGANALGIAYAHIGRLHDARTLFERILARDPRNGYALENLATIHMQQGDLASARAAFEKSVQLSPRSSSAHAGLGAVASQEGRPDAAIDHWRTAVTLDPRNYDALYNLATGLIRANRGGEARPYVEQFVRTAPSAFYARDIQQLQAWLKGA